MQPTIEQKMMAVLQCSLMIDDRLITPDSLLVDLSADSLALMDMILILGDVFEIEIEIDSLVGVHTVEDLCQMLHRRLA
ncbi:MAG: phosphopantetheine-binding protein [Plesiomonas sp.]|uniref:phosphopantetheine-binding protein n=1 Tax=Plesiomonas sp. TaxID=2486279 RepID=UPI003F3986F0